MSKTKLTIGSAVYDDFRIKTTFQDIMLQLHAAGLRDVVEFVLVDNKPDSHTSQELQSWIKRTGIRYIPMPTNQGTSGPRQRIFEEARGNAVLVVDAHVLTAPGAVVKLIAFYDANPQCSDLFTGPNVSDDLQSHTTHYNLGWRKEFFGMWGTAWSDPHFGEAWSAVDRNGIAEFVKLPDCEPYESWEHATGDDVFKFPVGMKYGEHAKWFREAGFKPLGYADADDFVIPAMGLGLFSCRREAWVGFNPNFRGFGGAEHYIHEKFKQRGNCTRSLGFLKWWHDFSKIGTSPYPVTLHDKLRNTVTGYQEIGYPLDDVRRHFVEERKRLSAEEFDVLVADPLNCPTIRGRATLEDYFDRASSTKGPMQQHVVRLRKLAELCEHVTEVSQSKGSLAAFAAGLDRDNTKLVSYNSDTHPMIDQIAARAPFLELHKGEHPTTIEPTDLLFIGGKGQHVRNLLQAIADGAPVRKYIALHDVGRHADLAMLCERILIQQPQWFLIGGSPLSGGLLIFSCDERQRPAQPIIGWLPGKGPGTELKKILESLGVNAGPTCDCRKRANDMDIMGIEGCKENREMIIGWLRDGQDRWGWRDKLKAAAKAIEIGLAFKLNPLDPFPGLVDEAIRRAEAAAAAEAIDATS